MNNELSVFAFSGTRTFQSIVFETTLVDVLRKECKNFVALDLFLSPSVDAGVGEVRRWEFRMHA